MEKGLKLIQRTEKENVILTTADIDTSAFRSYQRQQLYTILHKSTEKANSSFAK